MKIFLSFFLSFFVYIVANAECHPEVNKNTKQYILGYGSLISEKSKRATVSDVSDNIPVYVEGFRRGWIHLIGDQIYLGSVEDPKFGFNAVVFSLNNPEQIKDFDKREIEYCRKQVLLKDLKVLTNNKVEGDVWIYVTKHPKYLDDFDRSDAVDASYIYTFLSGCLDVKRKFRLDDFLENCMALTYNWTKNIKYDLAHTNKLGKGRIVPEKQDVFVVNDIICSDSKVLKNIKKDSEFYLKACKKEA